MAKSKATKGKSKGKAAVKPGDATHYTDKGTRKFQCNGPVEWAKAFGKAAAGGREGEGIRAALAYAIANEAKFLAWAKGQAKAADKADAKPEAK
jgi:hypothetical protein